MDWRLGPNGGNDELVGKISKRGAPLRRWFGVMLLSSLGASTGAQAEYVDDPSFQVCTNATGYYDVAATNDWLGRLKTSDAKAMREVSGKWYAEFYNQQLGMTYNNVITYLSTGVMDFTTRTCSEAYGMRSCTDDYGHGLFTAHRDPDGWIFVTRNVTSLTRINACGGGYVRKVKGVLIDRNGTRWKRMK